MSLNSKSLLGCVYEMFCKINIISFVKDETIQQPLCGCCSDMSERNYFLHSVFT